MADITVRLIFYRLGEVAELASSYVLDEDVDVLDLLLAFWVLLVLTVLLIVYCVDWLRRRFGGAKKPQEREQQLEPEERAEPITRKQYAKTMTSAGGSVVEAPIRAEQTRNVDGSDDSCNWLNRLMTWMFLNYSGPPQWLEDWLRTLNDELRARSRGQKNGLHLVRFLAGGLPPKLLSFRSQPDDDTRCLFLRGQVFIPEVGFRAQILPKGPVCDITVRSLTGELEAQLRIAIGMDSDGEGVRVLVKFGGQPRMQVSVSQPVDKETSPPLDVDWIRRQISCVLEEAVTEVSFPGALMCSRGDRRGVEAVLAEAVAATSHATPSIQVTMAVDAVVEDVEAEERVITPRKSRGAEATPNSSEAMTRSHRSKERRVAENREKERPVSSSNIPRFFSGKRTFGGAKTSTANGSVTRPLVLSAASTSAVSSTDASREEEKQPPVPPRSLSQDAISNAKREEKKAPKRSASPVIAPSAMRTPIKGLAKGQSVLAKVIKAGGLVSRKSRARERSLYCVVEMDEPYQRHSTGNACGSSSAFWDQGFELELNCNSQRISFAVFDGEMEKNSCLGQATVPLTDLMEHPSSRQIIPLVNEPSRTRSKTDVQPNITVEFLFMFPSPGDALLVAAPPKSDPAVTLRDLQEFMSPPESAASPRGRPMSSVLPSHGPRLHIDVPVVSLEPHRLQVAPISTDLPQERGRPYDNDRPPPKRSRSFASLLRKTFRKGKLRSKSADRISARPEEPPAPQANGKLSAGSSQFDLQRSKSFGLSGSFRRLFTGRRAKHQAVGKQSK